MNTASHRRMLVLWVVALAAALALAAAGTAAAQPPITETEVDRFTETLPKEPVLALCGSDELFNVTANVHMVEHFTYSEESGALHYRFMVHAKSVIVPEDGGGPTYTGRFRASDSENIRNVKQDDVLVETNTDVGKFVAKGSDGSKVTLMEHHHFTVNATGETTVEFDKVRVVGCEGISEGD